MLVIMRYDNVIYSLVTKLHCFKFVTHQVMTFEEDSKDVQEAEEEVPAVSAEAEEMLEGREEQVEEGGEEDVEGKPEEGGDVEASAEELQ